MGVWAWACATNPGRFPQTIEVALIESRQVNFRLAVRRHPRTCALIRLWLKDEVGKASLRQIGIGQPPCLFPSPQAEEVVIIGYQEFKICLVIELVERVRGADIYTVVPSVRARKVNGVATIVRKISLVLGIYPERTV